MPSHKSGLTGPPHRTGADPVHPAFAPGKPSVRRPAIRSEAIEHFAVETSMTLLIYYIVITGVLSCISIAIGLAVEQVAVWASMPIFIVLFFLSLWVGWIIAVKLTEPKTRSAPAAAGAPSDQRA